MRINPLHEAAGVSRNWGPKRGNNCLKLSRSIVWEQFRPSRETGQIPPPSNSVMRMVAGKRRCMFLVWDWMKERSSMMHFHVLQTALKRMRDSAGTRESISWKASVGASDMLGGIAGVEAKRRRLLVLVGHQLDGLGGFE